MIMKKLGLELKYTNISSLFEGLISLLLRQFHSGHVPGVYKKKP